MKKILLILFTALLSLSTCSNERDLMEGDCAGYPYFPTTEFSFSANGGDQIISYKYEGWWVNDFMVDSVEYSVAEYSCAKADTLNMNTPYVCYSQTAAGAEQLEGAWLTIQWSAPKQLTLIAERNTTGKDRKIRWFADYGNCGHSITVTQSAE